MERWRVKISQEGSPFYFPPPPTHLWKKCVLITMRTRVEVGLAGLGPKVVSLAGHHDVFLCRLKQGDTVKVTVGNRLKRHWIQHTIVDAGRRLFGAIIYLHALHENRARHVYGVTSSLPSFSFFSSSLEISIHPYSS